MDNRREHTAIKTSPHINSPLTHADMEKQTLNKEAGHLHQWKIELFASIYHHYVIRGNKMVVGNFHFISAHHIEWENYLKRYKIKIFFNQKITYYGDSGSFYNTIYQTVFYY